MKLSKKIGCVLLSVLMLVTSLSVGFSAVAADAQYDRLIDAIKDGQTDLDPTYDYYVKDLTNYTVQNVSDQWSTEGNTLGYRHVVTAKDNLNGDIANAAMWFYDVVDDLESTEYGVGAYTTALIASEIKSELFDRMSGEDHMLRTDSTGNSLYVGVQGVTVNQGMTVDTPIEIDELSSAQVRASVFPANASNQTVFWRVISGTDVVAIDQQGRIYAKAPGQATLQCVAVDSLDVTQPAVYNEDGEVIQPPVISFDNAKYAQFYVTVNNAPFTQAELEQMLAQFTDVNGDPIPPETNLAALEEQVRNLTLATLPDYGKTGNDILAELAGQVPENLEEKDAARIRHLLDQEERSDADYAELASFCYSAVQEEVLSSQNINIADYDLANLSSSGLTPAVVTAIHEIISDQAEALYNECDYTDEYRFFNVDALVNYFIGSANVINTANWYHEFTFTVATDRETAMMDIFKQYGGSGNGAPITAVGSGYSIPTQSYTYTWKHRREYDASGTEARYVIDGGYVYKDNTGADVTDAFQILANVYISFNNIAGQIPGDIGSYSSSDAQAFLNNHPQLEQAIKALWEANYSTELLSTAFGKSYYWIMSVYNQLRPNYANDQAHDNGMPYPELYAYRENVRSNPDGSSVPYAMTSDRVDTIVSTIDAMLQDENIAQVVSSFFNFSDPQYLGTPVYGKTFDTLQEMLQLLIQSLLYNGDIPTLILQKVYPLLTGLIHNTVMPLLDSTTIPVLGSISGIINGLNDGDDASVEVTLLRALNSAGIYIYPYEYAESWTQDMIDRYPDVYAVLHQDRLKPSGRKNADTPKGYDYTGSRENVGWDQITEDEWETISRGWGISTRAQFEDALAVSLNTLLPLLGTVLGNQILPLNVIGFSLDIRQLNAYQYLIAPLFDALGIPGISVADFNAACAGSDKLEILKAITTPLLDWVENEVLAHPIESIANLLVNLVSLLGYTGAGDPDRGPGGYTNFVQYALNQIGPENGIALGLIFHFGLSYNITIFEGNALYDMIGGLLPEGMSLDSLNGILGGLDLFKAPIVVEYNEYGEPVFRQTIYDDAGNVTDVTTTTDQSLADTQKLTLPPIQEGKLKEAGQVQANFVSPINGMRYSNVHYTNVNVGQILMYLFRYIFYGIMNTPYPTTGTWATQSSLLDAFLPPWNRSNDLFAGLTIDGIINNIVYNPEEAICALMELFAPNESNPNTDPPIRDIEENVYKLAYPDYQQDILLERDDNGNLIHDSFGAKVNYTKYWTRSNAEDTVENVETIVANVLSMLGMGSIDDMLEDLLNDNVFTSNILSTLGSALYTALQSLQSTVDLQSILDAAFDVRYDVNTLYNTLVYNMYTKYGFTSLDEAPDILKTLKYKLDQNQGELEWSRDLFYESIQVVDENGDPVMEEVFVLDENGNKIQAVDATGQPVTDADGNPVYQTEKKPVYEERPIDWGLGEAADSRGTLVGRTTGNSQILTREDVFFDALSAMLSPLTLIFQRVLMGQNLSVFTAAEYPDGLLTIPMYQIYYYALIPLFEALGMPDIVSFDQVKRDLSNRTQIDISSSELAAYGSKLGATEGDILFFEDLLSPVRGLLREVRTDPISTVLDLVPNLLFYISVGALNDTLNNVLHFAYVLLDILNPIVDAVPIVNNLLAGLEVAGIQLNLSLPLEVDFNTLINQLIGSFTEGTLLEDPLQGSGGIEVTDGLFIKIPPIDLSMLCVGAIQAFMSASDNEIVKIGTGDGADLITVILQLAMEILFMYDNWENVSLWLADMGLMDDFDTESIYTIFTELNKLANEKEAPDRALQLIYVLLKYVAPISGELAERLENMPNGDTTGMTITEFIDKLTTAEDPISLIKDLLTAKPMEGEEQVSSIMSFFQRIVLFFQRLIAALRRLLGIA